MIPVWKRKWEPTPGLSKRNSLTGNACFPIPQLNTSTYFYLLILFLCFLHKLKRCFLTSVKPLVVKEWNYTYDVSCNYRASNFYFWLIPTPKRSVQKLFSKGLNWPAKVCQFVQPFWQLVNTILCPLTKDIWDTVELLISEPI